MSKTHQKLETQEAKIAEWVKENPYPTEAYCPLSGMLLADIEDELIPDSEILSDDQSEAEWVESGYIKLLTEAYGCTYSVDCTLEQAQRIQNGEDPHSVLDNIDDYIWSYEMGTEYNADLEREFERLEARQKEWEDELWKLWKELYGELDPEDREEFTFERALWLARD